MDGVARGTRAERPRRSDVDITAYLKANGFKSKRAVEVNFPGFFIPQLGLPEILIVVVDFPTYLIQPILWAVCQAH